MIIALGVQGVVELASSYIADYIPPFDFRMLLLSFSVATISVGTVGCIYMLMRDGLKNKKGKDMITEDRNNREHAILLDIFVDGILDRQAKGELSVQTAKKLMTRCAEGLGLLDLLPKKKIAELVKSSLKNDAEKREAMRKAGVYKDHPLGEAAGPPPTPVTTVKKSSFKTMGRAVRFLGGKSA